MKTLEINKNYILCGDNKLWLERIANESVQLCYIDPPFFTNRRYEVIWGNGYEIRSFDDRFEGGVERYIDWIAERVKIIHRKIAPSGSIFLHCDWHASHRLRSMLDKIFGENNFRNEIIWKRTKGKKNNHGQGRNCFETNTDTILFYSKSDQGTFFPAFSGYSEEYLSSFYKYTEEGTGRRYRLGDIAGPGGAAKGNPFYEVMGVERYWRYSKLKMKALIDQGLIVQSKPGAVPAIKRYLDQGRGVPVQSLWDDLEFSKNENLGYPTQKPESLLKRIIACSTGPGDTVLDCFAGGGGAAKAALDLGRHYIIGDVSPVAVRVAAERVKEHHPAASFCLENMPNTVASFRKINGHKFAELVCSLMGWAINPRKSGDSGIDGWDGVGNPLQIKNQMNPTGRDDVQRFYGAMAGGKYKAGTFVAWDFSKAAVECATVLKREHDVEIVLMKCSQILDCLLISEDEARKLDAFYVERVGGRRKKGHLNFSGSVAVADGDSTTHPAAHVASKATAREAKSPVRKARRTT